jgi:hypothetical protein
MLSRKSESFILFIAVCTGLFLLMFVHASFKEKNSMPSLKEKRKIVRELELTDLCLFTDARYTRHPSMADLSTPFQDHPMSLEHFPSGAIMPPSSHLMKNGMD